MATPADETARETAGEGDGGGGRDESGDRAVSPGERRHEIVAFCVGQPITTG
ncbi:MAG TPA: hypothetical protein VFB77_10945 [Acidimicrobiales bacterium]|nr:hypothetical protein [Acidimicrobiales bacterium]